MGSGITNRRENRKHNKGENIMDYRIKVKPDEDCDRGDFYAHGAKVYCWHDRYQIGNSHQYKSPGYMFADLIAETGKWGEITEAIGKAVDFPRDDLTEDEWLTIVENDVVLCGDKDEHDAVVEVLRDYNILVKPLYMYDHSGVRFSLAPFPCRWDSGQVGWVVIHQDKVSDPDDTANHAVNLLNEIAEGYYMYLIQDADGSVIDSCGGFAEYNDACKAAVEELGNIVKRAVGV
ncbi:MAG: hypothetical protein D6800_00080 [Candidatus Zixiibacteriota bacterium]|nr:MAG: hypothetical protein D6800_00080 [candidate division Zixibacteria bacterium]